MPLSPQVREKIIEKEAFAPGDKVELGRNFAPSATLDRVQCFVPSALPEAQPAPRVHSSIKTHNSLLWIF